MTPGLAAQCSPAPFPACLLLPSGNRRFQMKLALGSWDPVLLLGHWWNGYSLPLPVQEMRSLSTIGIAELRDSGPFEPPTDQGVT